VNSNKKIRIPRLEQMLCHPPPNLLRLGALIPRQIRSRVWHGLSKLNGTIRPREPIDPCVRTLLQAEVAPKVDQLSKLLGRDLSRWYKD